MEPPAREDAAHGGLLRSLRMLLATLLATVRTRGELLQVEIEEEKLRVTAIVIFAGAAAFFLALAVVVLTFFLVLLFWDTHRVLVTGLIAVAYLLVGVGCALAARQRANVKSKLFAASLAELRKDGERLQPAEMSVDQYIAVALRKGQLLARIEVQREQIALYGAHLEQPFAAVDKALQVGRFIKQRPWIAGVAVLVTVLLRRRNLLRWIGRGWTLWRGWRYANQWLQRYGLLKI